MAQAPAGLVGRCLLGSRLLHSFWRQKEGGRTRSSRGGSLAPRTSSQCARAPSQRLTARPVRAGGQQHVFAGRSSQLQRQTRSVTSAIWLRQHGCRGLTASGLGHPHLQHQCNWCFRGAEVLCQCSHVGCEHSACVQTSRHRAHTQCAGCRRWVLAMQQQSPHPDRALRAGLARLEAVVVPDFAVAWRGVLHHPRLAPHSWGLLLAG